MQSNGRRGLAARSTLLLGASALGGCMPGAYVHDVPGTYYGGSGIYQPSPAYYYGAPGYYGYVPYPPRVVYVDHDHRGDDCRHDSHGRGDDRPGGNDRNDQRHQRNPPADGQAGPPTGRLPPPPPAQREARANGAGPPAAPPQDRGSRRERARQMADNDGPVKRSEERKDLD